MALTSVQEMGFLGGLRRRYSRTDDALLTSVFQDGFGGDWRETDCGPMRSNRAAPDYRATQNVVQTASGPHKLLGAAGGGLLGSCLL